LHQKNRSILPTATDRTVGPAGVAPAISMKRPWSALSADRDSQERVGRLGIEPRTRGLKVRCSAS
jgi:hypothetical protein